MSSWTDDRPQVSVRVGGRVFQGWLQSTIERSIEAIAGTFTVPVSLTPGTVAPIKRNDQVEVLIGDTVVLTGIALVADPFYTRKDCGLIVSGRDLTGDLVSSSALHQGGQWRKVKLDQIARDLCEPFGVGVVVATDVGAVFDDFKVWFGETVLACISRAARLRGVLVTRDDAGRLLLTKAGATQAPGELRRGQNIISMHPLGTDEDCHSEYLAYAQSAVGHDFNAARQVKASAKDAQVSRYCPVIVPAYGQLNLGDLQALVNHTAKVRRGHAMGFRYVVEGWLVNGKPWPLNARVLIHDDIAGLEGKDDWLIAAVKQDCDRTEGPVTTLDVRPVAAYDTVPLKANLVKHGKAQGHMGADGAQLGFQP